MTFWNQAALEPKRNYRWQLYIEGFDGNATAWWAKTVTLPSFDVSEVEHNYFDNKFYFPGRVSWSEVEATLVDPVEPDAAKNLMSILINSGYNIADAPDEKPTISKKKAVQDGIKKITISVFDSEETEIEIWVLHNAFIKAAKFGDMDYSNDELKTVSLTIRYDWASYEGMGTAYLT